MGTIRHSEEHAYLSVANGDLEIDDQGRVWRVRRRRWNRWKQAAESLPCPRHRAESPGRQYLQIHVTLDGKKKSASAHRLVWRHFHGPLPIGLTINHKNGVKHDNHPRNLELATPAEQARHAVEVLGYKPTPRQRLFTFDGERLPMTLLAERFGLKPGTVYARLKRGWALTDALKTPVSSHSST